LAFPGYEVIPQLHAGNLVPGERSPIAIFFKFPRPVKIIGALEIELELDSGTVTVPCTNSAENIGTKGSYVVCHYEIEEGYFDHDGEVQIPRGGVKFTSWHDVQDELKMGIVPAPTPAQATSHKIGFKIYGGSHAIDLSVTPKTVREGGGERELTVTARNVGNVASPSKLVIPLTFTSKSPTDDNDWSVRGGPYSVTIPAGRTEGRTTVPFTAKDDLKNEADVEIVHIEYKREAMMTPFVRGADIRILDAAGIRLTASPATIAENGPSQPVTVKAEWADPDDQVLTSPLDIMLSWSGSAGSDDYMRSGGGEMVRIPANARSGSVTVTITPTDDLLFEGYETISIRGSAPGRTVSATEVTLKDDETKPAVSLSVDPASVGEGDAATTVTVSATLDQSIAMANGATTVTLDLSGTATPGEDYTSSWSPATPTITFLAGETVGSNTVSLTLTPVDDEVTVV